MQNVDEGSIVSVIGCGNENTPSIVIPFYDSGNGSICRIMTMEYGNGDGTLSAATVENVADLQVNADTVLQIL